MPRVHSQKAAKDYPNAGIKKGDTYFRWEFRYGGLHRSLKRPRASQLTQSKWSSVLSAQETIEDFDGDSAEALRALIEEAAGNVGSVAEEYQEADEAMGGHQGVNYERAEHLEALQSELEDIASRLESLSDDDGEEPDDDMPALQSEALDLDWDQP